MLCFPCSRIALKNDNALGPQSHGVGPCSGGWLMTSRKSALQSTRSTATCPALRRCPATAGVRWTRRDRQRWMNLCVERRTIIEVEQVFQGVRVCVARRQVVRSEEATLDQRQEGGVVRYLVRHVMRFRERGHHEQRDTDAQLIERGTGGGERFSGIEIGTELSLNRLALGAVQPLTRLRAYGWVGRIGALPRLYPVRGTYTALRSGRWCDVVIKATVLVIGDEDDRVAPVWTLA